MTKDGSQAFGAPVPTHPARLSPALIDLLCARADVQRLEKGKVLFEEGAAADAVYVLLAGRVKVFSRGAGKREVIYNLVGPGELLGELFLDGGPRSASVEALEDLTFLAVKDRDILALMEAHPELSNALVVSLIARLRRATQQIRSLSLDAARARVVSVVREMVIPDGEHHLLPSEITQQFIASRVGATREMVSQVMRGLIDTGYLRRDGDRGIVVLKELPRR
jgi:CRP/FNR family cyclic AMP-dependent transcriptional regulator